MAMTHPLSFSLFLSFAATLMLIPFARKLARITGFVDKPGGRKQHEKPVPPVGGLVVLPVYMIVNILTGADIHYFWTLYAGLIILLLTGALDERLHINATVKFIVQIAVAALVVLDGNARIFQVGNLFGFGDVGLAFLSIPLSIVAVVLMINAMNLLDGLDGLAGGYAVVALFWLMFASYMSHAFHHVLAMAPLLGALIGFLAHNMRSPWRRKASVFLGDAGSMGLGLALAWFSISLAHQKGQVLPPISIAWILALPVIDTVAQFYRRLSEGKHPFAPDRGHFHHHLIHAKMPTGEATGFILCIAFVCGAIGYLGIVLPQFVLTIGWLALLGAHVALTKRPEIYERFFAKLSR